MFIALSKGAVFSNAGVLIKNLKKMFLGKAIYETLDENGEMNSYIMAPYDRHERLIVDSFQEVNSQYVRDAVDVGPLRIYAQENGINFKFIKSSLGKGAFSNHDNNISLDLNHYDIPLKPNNAGYYGLLLPKGYSGNVDISIKVQRSEQAEYANKIWLEDTKQIYVSSSFRVYADQSAKPNISIRARLTKSSISPAGMKTSNFKNCFGGFIEGLHEDSISNLIREINRGLKQHTPSVFICHSSVDKPFARKLAHSLSGMGIKVWIDEAEIRIGDSLIDKIEKGIFSSNNLIVVLTPNSVSSNWCKEELKMALAMQIEEKQIRVLPALFENCQIPGFLIEKAYADFRDKSLFPKSVNDIYNAVVS